MACFILQIQSFLLSVCPTIGPLLQSVLHVSCAVAESPPPLSEQNERWCDCGRRAVSNRGETCSAEAAPLQIHCEMAYSQITSSLNDWFDDSNQSFNDNSFFLTIDDYLIASLNLYINPKSLLQNTGREFWLSSDILF